MNLIQTIVRFTYFYQIYVLYTFNHSELIIFKTKLQIVVLTIHLSKLLTLSVETVPEVRSFNEVEFIYN